MGGLKCIISSSWILYCSEYGHFCYLVTLKVSFNARISHMGYDNQWHRRHGLGRAQPQPRLRIRVSVNLTVSHFNRFYSQNLLTNVWKLFQLVKDFAPRPPPGVWERSPSPFDHPLIKGWSRVIKGWSQCDHPLIALRNFLLHTPQETRIPGATSGVAFMLRYIDVNNWLFWNLNAEMGKKKLVYLTIYMLCRVLHK